MDTKKLAALAAAVRLGSFTRAAEELGYTQSGLTHMMNSLEKDVGFPLLVRGRTGVRLTPAGQRIFPLVQECLNGAKALEREILLINTQQEESVRVAAYDSIARHWLPEVIQRFRRAHPDVAWISRWAACRRSIAGYRRAGWICALPAGRRAWRWTGRPSRMTSCSPYCRRTTTTGDGLCSRWRISTGGSF